jgi:hypothetical protein
VVAAIAAIAMLVAMGVVGVRVWKGFRARQRPPVQQADGAKPNRLSVDELPQRVSGKPLENRYLSSPLEPTDDDVRRRIEGVQFELWYGIYKRKRKIGFARVVMRKTGRDEPGAYFSSFDVAMRPGFGPDVNCEFEADYYSGDAPFRLLAVKSRSRSADGDVVRDVSFGEREGNVTETVDGVTKPARTIPATRDTLAGLFATTVAGPEHVKPGQTASTPTFDVELLKDELDTVTVIAIGERHVAGANVPVATFEVRTPDDDVMTANVARGGQPLDLAIIGLTLRPEPREMAIDPAQSTAAPAESAR